MYGAPFYGGIVPYAYPAPSAAGVPGSETTVKSDKAAPSQPMPVANGSAVAGSATLPPRVRLRLQRYLLSSSHCWRGMCKV